MTPEPAKSNPVAITYRYNNNGIVEVEAKDIKSDSVLSHRLSSEKYSLQDVINGNIPTHIALILDCSGSMYGEALDAAKVAIKRFIESNISPNRSIAIFCSPGSSKPIAGPTNDPGLLLHALNDVVAIGNSDLHKSLYIARRALKERGAIFLLLSDGHIDDRAAVEKECTRIRKQGGRIFSISVGPNTDKAFLKSLCAAKEDYAEAYDQLSISHALNNILTQVD